MAVLVALTVLAHQTPFARATEPTPMPPEYSFDLWDWTRPCQDLALFNTWAQDLKSIGVTRLEISAPWRLLEPAPGQYDLSFIADRLAIAKRHGLALRLRINSYYNGATPAWYRGAFWLDAHGQPPTGTPVPPSLNDPQFLAHYYPLCTAIARRFQGEDVYYNAFTGIHAELKWADWWSYDAPTLALWRKLKQDRPDWLKDVVGDADLPDVPPVPPPTRGTPDNTPVTKAWIAFREHVWRDAQHRFNTAIHEGDPHALTSAPLGESYRRQSADFSNLDYHGLSRGASQVVHSYDFYWHPRDPAWQAGAAVASFRGITGLPVVFEFDGPTLTDQLHYSVDHLTELARAATAEGAGIKAANYSYADRLPSSYPALKTFGETLSHAGAERTADRRSADPGLAPPPNETILLFVSKWTTYCYREKTEWLHEAQFCAWKMLRDHDYPVRFICEDNLDENLHTYRGLYVAFSPPELLPAPARTKLLNLQRGLPTVVELSTAPAAPPTAPGSERNGDQTLSAYGSALVLDYALAYHYVHGKDHAAQQRLFDRAVRPLFGNRDPR